MKKNNTIVMNDFKKSKLRLKAVSKAICICLVLLGSNWLKAQSVDYAWSKNLGGGANEQGKAITTDAAGNVYTTGAFVATADFDPSSATSNLTSVGSFDIFVSKLDAAGNFVWAKGFGGSSSDLGNGICVDGAGNVYTTGRFTGTVDFDPGSGTANLTSNGASDIFISKLDAAGNYVWAKSFGAASSDEGYAVRVDASGNVYATGAFVGTADFNPGAATSNLISNGSTDVYIVKLDAAGNLVWAKNFGGSHGDRGLDLKLDNAGNIFTTGAFRSTADFDPGAGTTNLTSVNGAQDVFISKLDAAGNFAWAKVFGGTGDDVAHGIALDDWGNIFTTGEFSETANFNPGTGTSNLTAYGSADAFVSKLDGGGNFLWAKNLGGTDLDRGYGIATDATGNVYTTGEYRGTADFKPGKGTSSFSSLGNTDIYISKLDPSGNYLWAHSYGRNIEDKGFSMDVDESGNVYATGHFWVSIDFDPGPAASWVSSKGGADIFVLKFGCTPTTGTKTITACNEYTFNGITYTSDNSTATDTLTNSVGCDSIITLDLTINNLDVSTTQTGNTIMANLSGAEYQWINCSKGNAIISGAIDASYTATLDGDYAVIVTFKGCSDTSDCVTIGAMDIDDISHKKNRYTLYPNPTTSHLMISNFSARINQINVLDLNGKTVRSFAPKSNLIELNNLQNGIYFIQIQEGKDRFVQKIIKQ